MNRLLDLGSEAGALLKQRGETIAVSESSSGGLVSAALLSVGGASAYFLGGGVIYTPVAARTLLEYNMREHPGVRSSSEPYAALAASHIRERLGADWGLSETGAAGPSGNRYGDSPGHSCIAVTGPLDRAITMETGLSDREQNMWLFAEKALTILTAALRVAPALPAKD